MARPIGEIIAPIVARAEKLQAFQSVLNALPTPAERKIAIMDAHCFRLIDMNDTRLLIEAYQLETA